MTPRGRDWALVGAAWLVVVGCVTAWLAIDRRPPEWDYANHLERAVSCARDLAAGDWRTILERSSFYPPVVPCAGGVVYRVLPTDVAAGAIVMLLFLGMGMAATYALGNALADGTAGVAAAWIFGAAPFVVFSALHFQLDLPLTALVAVALVVLLRTEGFTRTGWSAVAGLVFGLGMLTKPPFAAYLLPPVVWALARGFGRRAVVNLGLATLVAMAVSLPWYGPRLVGMPRQIAFRAVTHAAEEGKPPTLSAAALAFYPTSLPAQLGLVAVALLVAGAIIALARRQGVMVVAFLGPFVLFMLLRNKDLRYTLPLLPAAAALAGLTVASLGERARVAALGVLAVIGALQISAVVWAVPPPVTLPGLGVPWVLTNPPARGDWHQRDFLRVIAQDRAGRPAVVSVIPNDNYFSVSNFRYYATRDELPLRFMRPWEGEPLGIDYMILKTGDQGPDFSEAKSLRAMQRLERDAALARAYPVVAEFALPDGSTGTLRARRLSDPAAAAPDALARSLEAALRQRLGEVARDVEGLEIRLAFDPAALARGRVQRLEITARAAAVGELRRAQAATLRLQDLRVVAEDVLVNPYALEAGRAEFLDIGRLRLERATVAPADLQAFLTGLKGFRGTRVRLVAGAIDVAVAQPGPDLSARVRVVPAADRPIALAVDRARLGWVPLPRLLVNWVVRNYDPTRRIASRVPFPVDVARVTVSEQGLRVGD
ncbi:MAG TPA: LmeA family phospholipid-binding protein [Methylomirabilota bacterium]|nr:LmeA family phospholipid-binding protein [Methylomirabilota bacterium]